MGRSRRDARTIDRSINRLWVGAARARRAIRLRGPRAHAGPPGPGPSAARPRSPSPGTKSSGTRSRTNRRLSSGRSRRRVGARIRHGPAAVRKWQPISPRFRGRARPRPALASPPAREARARRSGRWTARRSSLGARPSRGPSTAASPRRPRRRGGRFAAAAKRAAAGSRMKTSRRRRRRSRLAVDVRGRRDHRADDPTVHEPKSELFCVTRRRTRRRTRREERVSGDSRPEKTPRDPSDAVLAENLETRVAAVSAAPPLPWTPRAPPSRWLRARSRRAETVEQFMGDARARAARCRRSPSKRQRPPAGDARVRAPERAAMTPPPLPRVPPMTRLACIRARNTHTFRWWRPRRPNGGLPLARCRRRDPQWPSNFSAHAPARSAIEVLTVHAAGAIGGRPAPTETGAFIDFYSGVLGVDRAQLTLKR